MVVLEAVSAKFGDALLLRYEQGSKGRLWVIDGGPAGVWTKYLRPRLEELRGGRGNLVVDLAMLSHVDDDHVNGILRFVKTLAEDDDLSWIDVRRFWHNSFSDLAGSESAVASVSALASTAQQAMANETSLQVSNIKLTKPLEIAVLASINQGRELRDYLQGLQLNGNQPFNSILSSASGKKKIDGANVTLLGPIKSRLDVFRSEWKKAAGKPARMAALFRDDLDESPTNLSSIVALVEVARKRILLTGDARGDDVVAGFKSAMKGTSKLPFKLDLLKMPHHGSDRSISEDFLKGFPAKHYVISADGTHGNPDPGTIEALVETRGDDAYTIHLTNRLPKIERLLKRLSQGRNFEFRFRDKDALSMEISL